MSKMAKPCPKCGQYYPGDCFNDGCNDPKCECDGCLSLRDFVEDDED
jgi:hypothetical protein